MIARVLAALGIAVAVAACGDGTGPGSARTVSLSFATTPGAAPLLSRAGVADDTIVSGTDTLVISRAQIVLREIELKLEGDQGCENSGELEDDDGCEEFSTASLLVDLPLDGQAETVLTIDVPAGTYDQIDFEIHKPEEGGDDGSPDDDAFIAAHPDFADVSIRLEGTFNGQPFVYTSDLDVEQELELVPPLVVTDGTGTNVTFRVDLSTWFLDGSGALVDPASANKGGLNESVVKESIKDSFKAFEDQDSDGDETDED